MKQSKSQGSKFFSIALLLCFGIFISLVSPSCNCSDDKKKTSDGGTHKDDTIPTSSTTDDDTSIPKDDIAEQDNDKISDDTVVVTSDEDDTSKDDGVIVIDDNDTTELSVDCTKYQCEQLAQVTASKDQATTINDLEENVKIEIPAEALSSDTQITVKKVVDEDLLKDFGSVIGSAYIFEPKGLAFDKDVVISIALGKELPQGVNAQNLRVVQLARKDAQDTSVQKYAILKDQEFKDYNNTRSGKTNHFSAFAVVNLASVDEPPSCDDACFDPVENTVAECVFEAPRDGSVLTDTDDLKKSLNNFQYNVLIATSNLSSSSNPAITINGEASEAVPVIDTDELNEDLSTYTLEEITFPEGNNSIRADFGNGVICESKFTIETANCIADISLANNTFFLVKDDLDLNQANLQTSITINTDCNNGAVATLSINDGDSTAQATVSNGKAIFSNVTFPQGTVFLDASIQETNNGKKGIALRKTVEVDSIGPSLLNIAPTDGSTLTVDNGSVFNNGLNITITGSVDNAENGRTVVATVDLGLSTESSANTQITNGTFTFTNFNIKPGFHEVSFSVSDASGNVDSASVTYLVSLDVPTAQITSPSFTNLCASSDIGEDPSDGLQFDVQIATAGVPIDSLNTLNVGTTAYPFQVNAQGEATIRVSIPQDGSYNLSATVVNQYGVQSTSGTLSIAVDVHKPVFDITTFNNGDLINISSTPIAALASNIENGRTATLLVNNSLVLPIQTITDGVVTYSNVALKSGSNTIKISGSDACGNFGSDQISVSVDADPPSVVFVSPNSSSTPLGKTDDKDNNIDNGFDYDVVVQVSNESVGQSVCLTVESGSPVCKNTGSDFKATFTTQFPEGLITLKATATDAAKNTTTTTLQKVVNTGRLIVSITSPKDGYISNVNTNKIGTLTGIVGNTVGSTITKCALYLDSVVAEENVHPDNNGVLAFSNQGAGEGNHTLQIKCDDQGATGSSVVHNFTFDFTTPVLAFSGVSDGDYLNLAGFKGQSDTSANSGFQANISASITDSNISGAQATLSVVLNGDTNNKTQYTGTIASNGSVTFSNVTLSTSSLPSSGTAVITLSASDNAQNAGTEKTITINTDRVAPVISTKTPDHAALTIVDDLNSGLIDLQVAFSFNTDDVKVGNNITVTFANDGVDLPSSDSGCTDFGNSVICPCTVVSGNTATCPQVTFKGKSDGTPGSLTVTASGNDTANNSGSISSATTNYTVDPNAPSCKIVGFDTFVYRLPDSSSPLTQYTTKFYPKSADNNTNTSVLDVGFTVSCEHMNAGATVRLCTDLTGQSAEPTKCGTIYSSSYELSPKQSSLLALNGAIISTQFASIQLPDAVSTSPHHLHAYISEVDGSVGNRIVSSPQYAIAVDTVIPTISSITFSNNTTGNDNVCGSSGKIGFGISENDSNAPSGKFRTTASVVTTGVENGQKVTIYSNKPSTDTKVAEATVTSNTAVFSSASVLDFIQGEQTLTAKVSDIAGNPSSVTSAATKSIKVDVEYPTIVKPSPAFNPYNSTHGTVSGNDLLVNLEVGQSDSATGGIQCGTLSLQNGTDTAVSKDINSNSAATVAFSNFALHQGANTLAAILVDDVKNTKQETTSAFNVDSKLPTLAVTAPAGTSATNPKVLGATDDKDNNITDGYINYNGVTISITNVGTDTYTIDVLKRSCTSQGVCSGNYGTVAGASFTNSIAITSYSFPDIPVDPGLYDYIVRITDTADNIFDTSSFYINGNINVPQGAIERGFANVIGDKVLNSGDEILSGTTDSPTGFNATNDTDATSTYKSNFFVVTNVLDGGANGASSNNVTLKVKQDITIGTYQATTDSLGVATFTDVVLPESPEPTTGSEAFTYFSLEAAISDGPNSTVVTVSNLIADSTPPTLSFSNPANNSKFGVANDGNTSVANFQFKYIEGSTDNRLKLTTTGLRSGKASVSLSTNQANGTLSYTPAIVSSNAATFGASDVTLSTIAGTTPHVLRASVSDAAGNSATTGTSGNGSDLTLTIDITKPNVASISACIGETTGTDDDEKENSSCTSGSKYCGTTAASDTNSLCSRRLGNVTLAWTAPGDDSASGSVTSYNIKCAEANSSGTCSDFVTSFDSLSSASDLCYGKTVTYSPSTLASAGSVQLATVRGLNIHKKYCFGVQAVDDVGNTVTIGSGSNGTGDDGKSNDGVARREIPLMNYLSNGTSSSDVASGTNTYTTGNTVLSSSYTPKYFGESGGYLGQIKDGNTNSFWIGNYETKLSGSKTGFVRIYYSLSSFVDITGASTDKIGRDVAAGDVNGDSCNDLVIGAPGRNTDSGAVYIYLNQKSGSTCTGITTTAGGSGEPTLKPSVIISGRTDKIISSGNAFYYFGFTVAVGDLNNDNIDDIAIGAPLHDDTSVADVGRVFAFYGRSSWASTISMTADSDADVTVKGRNTAIEDSKMSAGGGADFDAHGLTIANVDGDNYDDILIGLPKFDYGTNTDNQGEVFIVYGSSSIDEGDKTIVLTSPSSGERVKGIVANSTASPTGYNFQFGKNVRSVGDVNGDSLTDFIVGPLNENAPRLYFGKAGGVDFNNNVRMQPGTGSNASSFGIYSAGINDFNKDGYNDIFMASKNGIGTVYFGGTAITGTPNITFSQAYNTSFPCFGATLSFVSDVDGDGITDVLASECVLNGGSLYLYR